MDRNNTVSQETCCIPAGVITEPDVSLQLEGKAYKDFSLKRVISSWRDRLFCPAEMQQFSARCREHVLTGHVSLIFSRRSPLLSDWWRVRYSDGGTGTHSWSVMFGGPIGGSTAKANDNSALMLDTRVNCAMMCLWWWSQWDEITIFGSLHPWAWVRCPSALMVKASGRHLCNQAGDHHRKLPEPQQSPVWKQIWYESL